MSMRKPDSHAIEAFDHDSGVKTARKDKGFTITEVIISIMLMGTVITVILTAIFSIIRVSSSSDNTARVEAMLTSAADRLAGWTYLSCPEANQEGYYVIVKAAASDVGWNGDQINIVDISFWDPQLNAAVGVDTPAADGGWVDTNSLAGTTDCEEDVNLTTSRTLQRVTIEATSPDGRITRSLQVVKSNVGDKVDGG